MRKKGRKRTINNKVRYEIGLSFLCLRCSFVSLSSLKSNLVPTRITAAFGQCVDISDCHFFVISFLKSINIICIKQQQEG